jgi:hypothetical protein
VQGPCGRFALSAVSRGRLRSFVRSKWTDQEVGIAIGRGALVLAVRCPENPYGFIAKHQALRGDLAKPRDLAGAIVDVLLKRPETDDLMREALTRAFENSPGYVESIATSRKIVATTGFNVDQLARLEAAITANNQVANAYGVNARLRLYLSASRTG